MKNICSVIILVLLVSISYSQPKTIFFNLSTDCVESATIVEFNQQCLDKASGVCDKSTHQSNENITTTIKINLNDKGDHLLKDATKNNVGSKLTLVAGSYNNVVGHLATIQSQIGGDFMIASDSDQKANQSISAIMSNNGVCGVIQQSHS